MTNLREPSTLASRLQAGQLNLIRDVEKALEEDPANKTAQALARRWTAFAKKATRGDEAVKAGLRKTWQDREHWPEAIRERLTPFDFAKISLFIKKAIALHAS